MGYCSRCCDLDTYNRVKRGKESRERELRSWAWIPSLATSWCSTESTAGSGLPEQVWEPQLLPRQWAGSQDLTSRWNLRENTPRLEVPSMEKGQEVLCNRSCLLHWKPSRLTAQLSVILWAHGWQFFFYFQGMYVNCGLLWPSLDWERMTKGNESLL